MNWFGKKVSKVNRLESESIITPQTNDRRSHLMASLLKQIFHLHLEFFCHKMLHILPKKVRNEQREKTLFMSENDQSGHQCRTLAQNPRDSSQLWPAAKDYYGIFGRAMLEVQKKLVFKRRLPRVLRPRATWAQVWREILNPREVHAKRKTKMASLFRNIVRLKFTKLLEFWL